MFIKKASITITTPVITSVICVTGPFNGFSIMFLPMVTGENWRCRSVFLETISLLYGTRKQFSNFCTTAWSGCNFRLVLMAAFNDPAVVRRVGRECRLFRWYGQAMALLLPYGPSSHGVATPIRRHPMGCFVYTVSNEIFTFKCPSNKHVIYLQD